jgi:hypothetical protein
MSPDQLAMFDLPELPAAAPQEEAPKAPAQKQPSPHKPAKQLFLDIRLYRVRTGGGDYEVQAASPSAAKYAAFRVARQTGQYCYPGGFLAFVSGGVKVAEVRR